MSENCLLELKGIPTHTLELSLRSNLSMQMKKTSNNRNSDKGKMTALWKIG